MAGSFFWKSFAEDIVRATHLDLAVVELALRAHATFLVVLGVAHADDGQEEVDIPRLYADHRDLFPRTRRRRDQYGLMESETLFVIRETDLEPPVVVAVLGALAEHEARIGTRANDYGGR